VIVQRLDICGDCPKTDPLTGDWLEASVACLEVETPLEGSLPASSTPLLRERVWIGVSLIAAMALEIIRADAMPAYRTGGLLADTKSGGGRTAVRLRKNSADGA